MKRFSTKEELIAAAGHMYDGEILMHGYVPYARDYEIILWTPYYQERGEYRFCFTHCKNVMIENTRLRKDNVEERHLNFQAAEAHPDYKGFEWSSRSCCEWPSYVENSMLAKAAADTLGIDMHEILIETQRHHIQLVFHQLTIEMLDKNDLRLKYWQTQADRVHGDTLREESREGDYACLECDAVLFKSSTKFVGGGGYLSFYDAVTDALSLIKYTRWRLPRAKFFCASCGDYKGQLTYDGPAPTGLKYSIDAGNLKFVPAVMPEEPRH